MLHIPDGIIVTLADFFMIAIFVSTRNRASLYVMPYQYVFLCNEYFWLKRHIVKFSKNLLQYLV